MTNQPSPVATAYKTGFFTFELNRLSREIGTALLARAGGVVLATATVLGLGAVSLPVHAGDFQVTKLADTADGTCDDDCSLREAVAATNTTTGADTITFASSVTGTITLDIATHDNIDITDELTITGPGADQLAVSGGDVAPGTENGGIFNATAATNSSTITGLTLTNGNSTGDGGAIYAFSDLALDGVSIRDCHADFGGGFNVVGDVTLTNSIVSNNTANYVGGFYVDGNATLTGSTVSGNATGEDGSSGGFYVVGNADITNSTVSGNEAGYYSGGFFVAGDATLTNSSVSDNTAGHVGGFYVYGAATLTNSTVSNNSASYVGGFNVDGNATLTGSTVSGNTSGEYGSSGGFYVYGDATLTNSTVSGNEAGYYGGGVYVHGNATLTNSTVSGNTASYGGGFYVNGNATITNSIVSGNTASSHPDVFVNSPFTLFAGHSLIGIYEGTYVDNGGNIIGSGSMPVDPLLGPLADNGGPTRTHAFGANSPAVDAGSNALAAGLVYDQRGPGYPRIVAGTVDMGAFEWSDRIFFDGFE